MGSLVTLANTASVTEADLLVERLCGQGIRAVARTHLDRTAYAGLGGAVVLVESDQREEAELELMLLTSGASAEGENGFDGGESLDPATGTRSHVSRRAWVRVVGYVALTAIAMATVVPSLVILWRVVFG